MEKERSKKKEVKLYIILLLKVISVIALVWSLNDHVLSAITPKLYRIIFNALFHQKLRQFWHKVKYKKI